MIYLTKFQEDNIPQFLSWLENTDSRFLLQFAGPKYQFPLNEIQLQKSLDSKDLILLNVVEESTDTIIGHCQFMRIDREPSKASIGRVLLAPEKRGKGYGLQMINAMKYYAKKELSLTKLDLRVYAFNKPAIECYSKAGFSKISLHKTPVSEFNETWISFTMECSLLK